MQSFIKRLFLSLSLLLLLAIYLFICVAPLPLSLSLCLPSLCLAVSHARRTHLSIINYFTCCETQKWHQKIR